MNNKRTWHPHPKTYKTPPFTVEVPGLKKVEGETIPRRNIATKDKLLTRPEESVATVYDILTRGSSKYGNAKCVGSRKLIRTHEEVKKVKKTIDGKEEEVDKKWTYYELGPYSYMSFIEYEKMALKAGAGLRKLGLNAQDRLHIFAATSPYWLGMAHGAASQSLPIINQYYN